MKQYQGSRWYKCDFHLHTMVSDCYEDKSNTPEQWVARALETGLDVVAVTDHNDYRGITPIVEEASKQGLHVFPGVEITCDTSKIHIVVLFDIHKNADTIRDFLNRCDIDSELIGKAEGTSMSVFEICKIAKKRGALVIAAHIDEFNSINSMNPSNLEKILDNEYIDAVQVVNAEVWRKYKQDKNAEAMIASLQEKYGPGATPEEIDRWRKCYNRALKSGIPMLSFSDNPCAINNSHHGLWGIGSSYTWIQMDESVDLESTRQSLFSPSSRIRMMIDSPEKPQVEPNFWLRSLEVRKTKLNPHQPIHLDFHPQLNCIIGGQGSGKSSIVKILSGVYQRLSASILSDCIAKQKVFYNANEEGIFLKDSEIEIYFSCYGLEYRLFIDQINSPYDQNYTLYMIHPELGEEEKLPAKENVICSLVYADTFAVDEIYQLATIPGALMAHIDSLIDMEVLHHQKEFYLGKIINLSLEADTAKLILNDEEQLRSEYIWHKTNLDHEFMPDSLKGAFRANLNKLGESIALIESCQTDQEIILANLSKCIQSYEDRLNNISKRRQDFLSEVMSQDENYKFNILPQANKESFYRFLATLFEVDSPILAGDFKKLEDLLFAKKNGPSKYRPVLDKIRNGQIGKNDSLQFSEYFIHLIHQLSLIDYLHLLYFYPEDELQISYKPHGVKKYFPINKSSTGEIICAILSFILVSGKKPLVIDHPESTIDNRIIFDQIIPKLKDSKDNRQVIITTLNANLATNTDPEMLIALDSRSRFVKVHTQGNLDNAEIRQELCDVLEGSRDAFVQRAKKYLI